MTSMTRLPAVRLRTDETNLCAWLGQATPGDILEYYRGCLVLDRERIMSRLPERERGELTRVGKRAFWAAEQGLAYLVQRRHGPEDYSYLIVARPRTSSARRSLRAMLDDLAPVE